MTATEKKLIEIICNYQKISPENIDPESNLLQDLSLSSFDVMNIVCKIEEEFDVEISERQLMKLRTVQSFATLIDDLVE